MQYTPEVLPPEWLRWLNKGRKDPPSEEDMRRYEDQRADLQQRVAILDAEEAKRKLRVGRDDAVLVTLGILALGSGDVSAWVSCPVGCMLPAEQLLWPG